MSVCQSGEETGSSRPASGADAVVEPAAGVSGCVAQAADYPWSSHAHWLGLRHDRLLTPHALYWALGNTPFAREAAYAALVSAGINAQEQADLTASALSGWALGDPDFVQEIQKHTPRRITRSQAGRPALHKAPH